MLIGGIALGLILGLIVGGRLTNLAYVRLHRIWLLVAAVLLRFATEILLNAGFAPVEMLRLPLLAGAFALLLLALWPNRGFPGISLAFVGILANAIVIVVNGGFMPIWEPSLRLAGLTPADVTSAAAYRPAGGARRELPAPSRSLRRRHPDPAAVHPERRVDR